MLQGLLNDGTGGKPALFLKSQLAGIAALLLSAAGHEALPDAGSSRS